MSEEKFQEILKQLQAQFPGVIAVTPGTALLVAGRTTSESPEQAARQAIYRKTFPFPLTTVGKRRSVLLTDIAKVLGDETSRSTRSADAPAHPDMIENATPKRPPKQRTRQ